MRKLSNRNEGGMSVGRRSAETGRRPSAELVFAGTVLLGFAVAVMSKAVLPSDSRHAAGGDHAISSSRQCLE